MVEGEVILAIEVHHRGGDSVVVNAPRPVFDQRVDHVRRVVAREFTFIDALVSDLVFHPVLAIEEEQKPEEDEEQGGSKNPVKPISGLVRPFFGLDRGEGQSGVLGREGQIRRVLEDESHLCVGIRRDVIDMEGVYVPLHGV